jgi:hypothetical protein
MQDRPSRQGHLHTRWTAQREEKRREFLPAMIQPKREERPLLISRRHFQAKGEGLAESVGSSSSGLRSGARSCGSTWASCPFEMA